MDEALRLGNAAYQTSLQYAGTSPLQQQPPPAQAPQYAATGDEEYVTGAQLRQFGAQAAQQYGPDVNAAVDLAASGNLAAVRARYAKDFGRYGPEIMANLATVPKRAWTIDNLEKVVKLSLVDHLDEIASERASHLAAQMGTTMRSSGAAGSDPVPTQSKSPLESDAIPESWRARAKAEGITDREVQEFCYANETTPEDFFKIFAKGMVTDAVAEVSRRR